MLKFSPKLRKNENNIDISFHYIHIYFFQGIKLSWNTIDLFNPSIQMPSESPASPSDYLFV